MPTESQFENDVWLFFFILMFTLCYFVAGDIWINGQRILALLVYLSFVRSLFFVLCYYWIHRVNWKKALLLFNLLKTICKVQMMTFFQYFVEFTFEVIYTDFVCLVEYWQLLISAAVLLLLKHVHITYTFII